ncbi:hypothetical protein [Nonomuraea candida]|uniref:hypothetical protein n=1 Tax=Nonomuraea candida TaxID=359159 RepID=UPI0012FCD7AF|nr:hypothetical protein [Nonomuraea candida]
MAADNSVTPVRWLAQQIETGDLKKLRSEAKITTEALMPTEADGSWRPAERCIS